MVKSKKIDKRKNNIPPIKKPKLSSSDQLLDLFKKYVGEKGMVDKFSHFEHNQEIRRKSYGCISIAGFSVWMNENDKKTSLGRTAMYDYFKTYPNTKKEIDSIIEQHTTEGIAVGDIPQAFGIFYLKNKSNYVDKIETVNLNIEQEIDLTDKELKKIARLNTDE